MNKYCKILLAVVFAFVLFSFNNVYAEAIDEVTVTGVKNPTVGDNVADLTASIQVPEGANYSILEVTWWQSVNGMYFYDMPSDATIEDNASYYVSVTLQATGDYEFPSDEDSIYTGTVTASDVAFTAAYADGNEIEILFESVTLGDINYHVIEGAGQTVNYGDEARFVVDGEYPEFEDGGFIIVDDEQVNPANYNAEEGSTVITLNSAFIETLDEGEHSLYVVYGNYKYAETTFTVAKNSSEITPPNTGVSTKNNDLFYISIILLSSISLIGLEKRFN